MKGIEERIKKEGKERMKVQEKGRVKTWRKSRRRKEEWEG